MAGKAAVKVSVSGLVQGVGFRYWTEHKARSLDLTGYVSNMPDGSVEALFEGDRENLNQMLEYLHQGPPAARVTAGGGDATRWR